MDKEGHKTHWTVPALPYKGEQPHCVNHSDRLAVGLYKDGNHLCSACMDRKQQMQASDWDRYDGGYPTFCDQPYRPTGGRTT